MWLLDEKLDQIMGCVQIDLYKVGKNRNQKNRRIQMTKFEFPFDDLSQIVFHNVYVIVFVDGLKTWKPNGTILTPWLNAVQSKILQGCHGAADYRIASHAKQTTPWLCATSGVWSVKVWCYIMWMRFFNLLLDVFCISYLYNPVILLSQRILFPLLESVILAFVFVDEVF